MLQRMAVEILYSFTLLVLLVLPFGLIWLFVCGFLRVRGPLGFGCNLYSGVPYHAGGETTHHPGRSSGTVQVSPKLGGHTQPKRLRCEDIAEMFP